MEHRTVNNVRIPGHAGNPNPHYHHRMSTGSGRPVNTHSSGGVRPPPRSGVAFAGVAAAVLVVAGLAYQARVGRSRSLSAQAPRDPSSHDLGVRVERSGGGI